METPKSAMEETVELEQLSDVGPNTFTNKRQLWHPPGARGVFGGTVIAQSLAAAQATVPSIFTVHSMHGYFVLAGDPSNAMIYTVEIVRQGRSFQTRTVQARQGGKIVFTATVSFSREPLQAERSVEHCAPIREEEGLEQSTQPFATGMHLVMENEPIEIKGMEILQNDSSQPHRKVIKQWVRARGKISAHRGLQVHSVALAYMSDRFFFGALLHAHNLYHFEDHSARPSSTSRESEGLVVSQSSGTTDVNTRSPTESLNKPTNNAEKAERDMGREWSISMMVSLDHTIYFHNTKALRADDWLLMEMETPWAGESRGLVVQRIWTKEGILVATCIQEGLLRLKKERNTRLDGSGGRAKAHREKPGGSLESKI